MRLTRYLLPYLGRQSSINTQLNCIEWNELSKGNKRPGYFTATDNYNCVIPTLLALCQSQTLKKEEGDTIHFCYEKETNHRTSETSGTSLRPPRSTDPLYRFSLSILGSIQIPDNFASIDPKIIGSTNPYEASVFFPVVELPKNK